MFTGVTAPFAGLVLRRELDATPWQLSLAASAGAAAMLLSLAWARLAAHRPPLPWVVWPAAIGRGLLLFAPLALSAWALTALLSLSAFIATVAGPAQTALVERVYPRVARGRAMAVVRAAGGVAAVGVSVVAGVLLETLGYRGAFALAGATGIAASLALLALRVPAVPDAPGESGRPAIPPREVATGSTDDRSFTALMLAAFLFGLGCWIQVPARPVTLADVVGITPIQLGWLGAAGGVAAIAGSLAWGRLADRGSSLDALRLVYTAGIVATLFYLTARSGWMLVGGFVADALLGSGLELLWVVALIDVAGPRRAARAAAVSLTLAGVRGLAGPPLGAFLIEWRGVGSVYVVGAGLMVVALVLLGRVVRLGVSAPAAEPATAALVRW